MTHCPVCASPVSPDATTCPTCGSSLNPDSSALSVGTQLMRGRYSVGRKLGQGGFGITYQGADTTLRRRVAIKELFVEGSSRRGLEVVPPGSLGTQGFEQTRGQFLEEARVVAQFTHPGIVRVWDAFEENRTAFIVMELLEGMDLGKRLEAGPLTLEEADDLIRELSEALRAVHAAGLLHRDLKPDNVFLNKDGRTVLIDFGSARAFAEGKSSTHTRLVTPGYAPPEQYASSAKFGPYTDIYAFGATLWHALSGTMPAPATDRMLGAALPPLPAHVPPAWKAALEQALELRIDDRPQTVQAFVKLLEVAPRAGPPPREARPQPAPTPPAAPPPARAPEPEARPAPTPRAAAPRPRASGIGGHRELARFSGKVFAVRFSPGGNSLAVSSCGRALLGLCTRGQVSLWNLRGDAPIRTLEAHSSAAYGLDFSPDGELLTTGGEDGQVRLWSALSGEVLQELPIGSAVTGLQFRSSGFHLAFGTQGGAALEWDLRAGQANTLLELPDSHLNALGYSPDGRLLVAALGSRSPQLSTCVLLNLQTGTQEELTDAGTPPIRSVAFSPDGNALALGDEAGRIHLWDLGVMRQVSTLGDGDGQGHDGAVRSLAFGPEGRTLASGGDDGAVLLWSVSSGGQLEAFRAHGAEVTAVSYRPGGGVIASGSFDNRVLLWDVASLEAGA